MSGAEIKKLVAYWTKLAEYDLKTAESLLRSKRYPYALFLCHLAIEKLLKARVSFVSGEHAPYTHNLPHLADMAQLSFSEDQKRLIADLTDFNLEARYPDWKRDFYKRATAAYTKEYVGATRTLFVWLKKSLNK